MHRHRLLFLMAPLAALLARPAGAQLPVSSVPPADTAVATATKAKAKALYDEGISAMERAEYPRAYVALLATWALQKHYKVAGNLGQTEIQLDRFRDAAEHLAIYVRGANEDPLATSMQRSNAQQLFESAAAKVLTITVATNITGAEVKMDGVRIGTAPLVDPIFAQPGRHDLEVRMDGYVTRRETVDGAAGDKKAVAVPLTKDIPPTPVVTSKAPSISTAGEPAPRNRVPAIVLSGASVLSVIAGGALLGAGFGTLIDASDLAPRKESGRPGCPLAPDKDVADTLECQRLRGMLGEGDLLINTGTGLLVAGGALGVLSGLYLLLPNSAKGASRLVPVVGSTGAAIVWRGAF